MLVRRRETFSERLHTLKAAGCRPWDVCAGSIIAQEAGCLVAGSHTSPLDNDVNQEVLEGRKYIVIRAIGDSEVRLSLSLIHAHIMRFHDFVLSEQTEKGVDAQKRLIKEFYETVDDFEPK